LPLEDILTFRDIFTTCSPRITLKYIELIILELGGTCDLNFQECIIDAKLATHNFPVPICISVRMFYAEKNHCNVVRFNRISGDTLQFAYILRKLTQECCVVLTGLPDDTFQISDNEQKSDYPGIKSNINETSNDLMIYADNNNNNNNDARHNYNADKSTSSLEQNYQQPQSLNENNDNFIYEEYEDT